jgi:hypothetical protein
MIETIDFYVQISTPVEKIASMKDKIKRYVNMYESSPNISHFIVRF